MSPAPVLNPTVVLPADSRWTIMEIDPPGTNRRASVQCICGARQRIRIQHLRTGESKSCGCLRREVSTLTASLMGKKYGPVTIHGDARVARLYGIWAHMRDRTTNPNADNWRWYGGKGVRVCEDWRSYLVFKAWALANGYANNLTIDRIDSEGNYEPGNCRWITGSENSRRAAVIRRNGKD